MGLKWYFPILIIYSIIIITLEYSFGADHIRHYLTDIKGPVFFYGIQTTVTTVLLSITSYNFILSYVFAKQITMRSSRNLRFFFLSQAILFLYLAIDERFILHESIGGFIGFNDALILLLIAFVQLVVFMYFKDFIKTLIYWNSPLVLGSICFVIMIIIDGFVPRDTNLRLSFEDLFKLWGIFFFFRYSYSVYDRLVKPVRTKLAS
jgi:hypothetical protein